MTDSESKDEGARWNRADWLLQVLVSATGNNAGEGVSLTLAIRGMLVSGVVVSASEYYRVALRASEETFQSLMKMEPLPAKDENPALPFVSNEHELRVAMAELEQRRIHDDMPIQYIHLEKARFFLSGANAPPIPMGDDRDSDRNGPYFRARLSSVDGFIPERLDIASPPQPRPRAAASTPR